MRTAVLLVRLSSLVHVRVERCNGGQTLSWALDSWWGVQLPVPSVTGRMGGSVHAPIPQCMPSALASGLLTRGCSPRSPAWQVGHLAPQSLGDDAQHPKDGLQLKFGSLHCCLQLRPSGEVPPLTHMLLEAQALQEEYRKDLTLKEAEVLALSTLKQVMEEKVRLTSTLPASHCHMHEFLGGGSIHAAGICHNQRIQRPSMLEEAASACPACFEVVADLLCKLLVTSLQRSKLTCV